MFSYVCVALVFVAVSMAEEQNRNSPTPMQSNFCKSKNGYYKVDASCDTYVECIRYTAETKTCPDGLHFNPAAVWPQYPCGYPMDVPCLGREASQPAQPTADCPHQYGFFKSPLASAENCGQYRQCVAGISNEMSCPAGLAFNPDSGRCDWPDNVQSCNTNLFLGFTCPAGDDANYEYHGNCYYFFSCTQGNPRLLQCDAGMAFDQASGRCVDEDRVNCHIDTIMPLNAVPRAQPV